MPYPLWIMHPSKTHPDSVTNRRTGMCTVHCDSSRMPSDRMTSHYALDKQPVRIVHFLEISHVIRTVDRIHDWIWINMKRLPSNSQVNASCSSDFVRQTRPWKQFISLFLRCTLCNLPCLLRLTAIQSMVWYFSTWLMVNVNIYCDEFR